MKSNSETSLDSSDDMLPEYTFDYSKGVRGKYYERAMRAKRLVEIDEDLLQAFTNKTELNAALRSLLEASKHIHVQAAA